MVRSPCSENISVQRGVFAVEENAKILSLVSKNGSSVSKKTVLKKCGKSCKLRWNNYLRPDIKHDNFTPQEEDLIIKLHAAIGSRFSIIAQQLPGRTDNDVKSHWNTKLKKKLSQLGIDPVTHKPFSKLIADYGNIGGSENQNQNAIQLKSEPYHTMPQGLRNFNSQPNQPPTSPSEMEPSENIFLFNCSQTHNPATDLAQLQAMPIMTGDSNCIDLENETIPASNIFEEGKTATSSSSSSSTSSTYSTSAAQEALPVVPFSWKDFLLEDAFAPTSDNQEQETVAELMSKELGDEKTLGGAEDTENSDDDSLFKEFDSQVSLSDNDGDSTDAANWHFVQEI
ncbi:hypothetical protein RIF29_10737 [Crotalaria pallida]|uniref:Uncharacterized protein n=1 Tax=Crotalaria pallida TaxID=3830 RepID=A0AAN9FWA7_CROPI